MEFETIRWPLAIVVALIGLGIGASWGKEKIVALLAKWWPVPVAPDDEPQDAETDDLLGRVVAFQNIRGQLSPDQQRDVWLSIAFGPHDLKTAGKGGAK
jgi:hypothetical protein